MNMNSINTVIAIDGPAGAGKSSVAKAVASKLGFSYLDTGAMYRALTLKALRKKVNLEEENALVELAHQTQIDLKGTPKEGLRVLLDGEDVSDEIRSLEVTNNTFYVAKAPAVREIMVGWQRAIGSRANVVAEGRDIGSVVFANTKYKFYLDADFEERANRRILELEQKGKNVEAEQLKKDLQKRDNMDFTRKVGPLKKVEGAIIIDSTHLNIEQVVDKILSYVHL